MSRKHDNYGDDDFLSLFPQTDAVLKIKEVQNCPLQAHRTDMEILLIHI